MPKRDGTGPKGKGRTTGRGRGVCSTSGGAFSFNEQGRKEEGRGAGQDKISDRNPGKGFGQRRGSGKSRGNRR